MEHFYKLQSKILDMIERNKDLIGKATFLQSAGNDNQDMINQFEVELAILQDLLLESLSICPPEMEVIEVDTQTD